MEHNLVSGLKKYKSLASDDSGFQQDSLMVPAGWQVVCLWPLLGEDAGDVLGLSRVSNITPAPVSTAQAGLFFTLMADVISLGRKCNCSGEVPSLGWQMPQHNRINISQAKWSETAEVKATVLEMTLVTERWLFCFFFVVVCVIKYFSSN